MKNRRTLGIVLVVGAALFTAVGRMSLILPGWPEQDDAARLKFSHRLHIKDVGVPCENCHDASKSKLASDNLRSGHDNCTSCHEEQVNNTCDYCHKDPESIQAAPAAVRTIVFSHEQHSSMKGVECATCHAGLDAVDYAGPENMPSMETCASCHNDRKASAVCESCHLSFAALVPSDHLELNFARSHSYSSRIGGLETECSTCHTQTFCAECHAPAGLVQFGAREKMSDPTPKNAPSNSPEVMSLQFAHAMNYRYTHGIDAKSKSADCYSCHSAQEFCAQCHTAGGIDATSYKPAWHLGGGFATLGYGSGGGRHAIEARRDIENCITCHDVQGNDPTCTTCHVDADGMKYTDPATHEKGYMNGEYGPWHTNQGAVCYNCHTDLNARPDGEKGRGFCGYCHAR